MKGSPLTIVIVAAIVIIGCSIVTYLLIESSPQEGGFDATSPQSGRTRAHPTPRPNVYDDTEPRPLPVLPISDDDTTTTQTTGPGSTTTDMHQRQTTQPKGSGGDIVKPLPPLPVPD